MSWKDKPIEAINRLSKKKGWSSSPSNPYFEQVLRIYESQAMNLKEFKHAEKKFKTIVIYFTH